MSTRAFGKWGKKSSELLKQDAIDAGTSQSSELRLTDTNRTICQLTRLVNELKIKQTNN